MLSNVTVEDGESCPSYRYEGYRILKEEGKCRSASISTVRPRGFLDVGCSDCGDRSASSDVINFRLATVIIPLLVGWLDCLEAVV